MIKSIVPKEKMDPQLYAVIGNDSSIGSSIRKDETITFFLVAGNDTIGKKDSVLALLDKNTNFFKH